MTVSDERLRNSWENIHSSLWFVPSMMALVALLFSIVVPEIDSRIDHDLDGTRDWLFFGTPSAARALLSVVAASLITVISLLYSIMILTVQQASTQYTPRIIANFTRDRANQAVLGIFISTFLYSVLIMRQIREESLTRAEFVPVLSISVAIVLALVCMGALVYFIHHSATLFQVSTVIAHIHDELLNGIDRLYPAEIGRPADDDADDAAAFRQRYGGGPTAIIEGRGAGFLRSIDYDAIVAALPDGAWAIVHPQVGRYLTRRQPLVEVGGVADVAPVTGRQDQFRGAFVLDRERTLTQDALFGVRQLADIALKALSAAINDPTTAEHAISALGDAIGVLAMRDFPRRTRIVAPHDNGGKRVVLWLNRPGFADYVGEAFAQVRTAARDQPHVILHLLEVMQPIRRQVSGYRAEVVQRQIDDIVWQAERLDYSPSDRARLEACLADRERV
jgi:uncharacterized membrane protein